MSRAKPAKYPLCQELGRLYLPLSPEQQAVASTEDRIRSVLPFLILKAAAFVETLEERQRANYDLEDLMSELWLELRIKDKSFDPTVASYITFAGRLARNRLSEIRDESRVVQSPKNSGGRLRDYEDARKAGTLSSRRDSTSRKIRRTRGHYADASVADLESLAGPATEAESNELRRVMADAVIRGMAQLTPYEAAVLGSLFGLWGQEPQTAESVSGTLGGWPEDVRAADRSARHKIHAYLVESGHTLAAEE